MEAIESRIDQLTPVEVNRLHRHHAIVLIDVREPKEFEQGHIPGAKLHPLSSFDPHKLPWDPTRRTVFCCGSGKRSLSAAQKCLEAGHTLASHLAGGMAAWKIAGLSVEPQTR
jgi:rhodanese-related sulfurtransferase